MPIKKSRHDLHGLVFYYRHFNINVNWELGLKGPFVDEFCQENGNVEIGYDNITGNSLDNTIEDICVLLPFPMLYNKKIFATVCLKEKAQYMHATFHSFSMKFGFCMEFAEVSFNQIKSIWIKFHFTAARQSQNTAFPLVCTFVHFFHFYSLSSTNHSAQEHILSIH